MSQIVVVMDRIDRAERIGAALRAAAFDTLVITSVSSPEFAAAWSRAAALVTDLTAEVLRQLSLQGGRIFPGPVPVVFVGSPGLSHSSCQRVGGGAARVVPWDGCDEGLGPLVAAVAEAVAMTGLCAARGPGSMHRRLDSPAADAARAAHYRRLLQRREQLVSGLAHDLRTPLTAVREFADLLEREAADKLNHRQRHYVEVIQRRCVDAARMLDNLLDTLRIQSGRLPLYRRPVPVREIVSELRDGFGAALRHQQVELALEVPDQFPAVFADADLLARILSNLVNNALKFSPAGSTILVAVERATVDLARMYVRDEGPGIERAELRRIFRSYVQGSSMPATGYGLGLAIVRQLVRYHGGRVSVESKLGRGSTFAFTLPLFIPLAIVRRFLRAAERRGDSAKLSCWGLLLPQEAKFKAAHRLLCSLVPAHDLVVPDEPYRSMLLVSRSARAELLLKRVCDELAAHAGPKLLVHQLTRDQIEPWLRSPTTLIDQRDLATPTTPAHKHMTTSLTG